MHTQLNQALSADRATELRRAAEHSRASAEYRRSHRGPGAAMAIRRYFDHAWAAHK